MFSSMNLWMDENQNERMNSRRMWNCLCVVYHHGPNIHLEHFIDSFGCLFIRSIASSPARDIVCLCLFYSLKWMKTLPCLNCDTVFFLIQFWSVIFWVRNPFKSNSSTWAVFQPDSLTILIGINSKHLDGETKTDIKYNPKCVPFAQWK